VASDLIATRNVTWKKRLPHKPNGAINIQPNEGANRQRKPSVRGRHTAVHEVPLVVGAAARAGESGERRGSNKYTFRTRRGRSGAADPKESQAPRILDLKMLSMSIRQP